MKFINSILKNGKFEMKQILILIVLSANALLSEVSYSVIFKTDYKNLPFGIEVDNSRIYSIASFDISEDFVEFSSFNKPGIFRFSANKYLKKSTQQMRGRDFVSNSELKPDRSLNKSSGVEIQFDDTRFRKNYFSKTVLSDVNGVVSGQSGEKMLVQVVNRNELEIKSSLSDVQSISLRFAGDLSCADLIGIDTEGNLFLVIEKYLNEIPLKVSREVYAISNSGNFLSILALPNLKYLYTIKDLQIDAEGNLYHLLSDQQGIEIVKWSGLNQFYSTKIEYPSSYKKVAHFNDYVPTNEAEMNISNGVEDVQAQSDRAEALRIGEAYVLHRYNCTLSNLAPNNTTAPDGDIVRTPDWLKVGINARIPYKWGGFNTLSQFDAGLAANRYAGDIHTDGVSSYAMGVDCSGFVSRCWKLTYHASTSYMPNITNQYASWDDLKPGDALHKVGHVRLFVEKNINGSLKIVESTSRGWGVSYWSYTTSDLSAYTPRYYNNMEDNYNIQRPTLTDVQQIDENTIELNWDCDTTGILGYRIYGSANGKTWNMGIDEKECQDTSVQIPFTGGALYFRVASVKNDLTESNWSNVLGIGLYDSEKTCLIVDGFTRESGSWRGAGHTFVYKYGNSIESLQEEVSFQSVKNSKVLESSFDLNDYDYVMWILGDESTADETFNHKEQALVKDYLEKGGNLFVTGSEIGWDLVEKGDQQDKDFYSNYLKAKYVADDAGIFSATGVSSSSMDGCSILFGQTYDEDYPDELEPINGSALCMRYDNINKIGAGVEYTGSFGSSSEIGKLIYLGFPLETTANDTSFNEIISSAFHFFNSVVSVKSDNLNIVSTFSLDQNYPNPFNPSTTINYSIPEQSHVELMVYDILGSEVTELVNKTQPSGNYEVKYDASNLGSGIYLYRFQAGSFIESKKMILVK